MIATRADYRYCRETLRHGSRSFFAASLLLPRPVRDPASALYAFCRSADDAVDEGPPTAQAIADLRDRLARAYDGRPIRSPIDRAFADVVAHFAIPRALPDALIEGLEWDTGGRRYANLSQLTAYAARVAGSVGAMMSMLMGARSPEIVARACDLGVAMQLTNIARDVGEDARLGRIYLPLDWLAAEGVDPDAWLSEPAFNPGIAGVTARLLTEAEALYARADAGIGHLPLACRPAMHAARRLYAEIGRRVEENRCDSVSQRAVVPAGRKIRLASGALTASLRSSPRESSAPLPETQFLVEAVRFSAGARERWRQRPPGPSRIDERAAWLVDLFGRLEALEHPEAARRAGARS